jgi:hypothetical protein
MVPVKRVLLYSKYGEIESRGKVMAIHSALQPVNYIFENIDYFYTP